MSLRWIVVLTVATCMLIFVLPPGWNMLAFVSALAVATVLASVAAARRNRHGMPQDWYTKRATDLQLEAETQRRNNYGGGGLG